MKQILPKRCLIVMLAMSIAAAGVMGCKAAREKRRQFSQAATAALNATLFANPLAAVYAHHGGSESRLAARVAAADDTESQYGGNEQ